MAQFFVDLSIEKREHLRLSTTIRQLEDELAQLRRQINQPSPFSLFILFIVDLQCSADFQDNCTLNNSHISKHSITFTLKRASSTTSKSRLSDQPRSLPPNQPFPGPPSSELEARVKQLEEEANKARNCRETILSIYRSQFTFLSDRLRALESAGTDTILWKVTSMTLVFDTAKSGTRLDDAAKDPSTHNNSLVFRTHPYGYNFFVQF